MSTRFWYSINLLAIALWPLSLVFQLLAAIRYWAYQAGILSQTKLAVPVIVVGNIVVGGSGKTPLVVYLVDLLTKAGYQPGIISRGYGGQASHWPQHVTATSDPLLVGDEPVLLAQRCQCPIVVAPNRVAAGQQLLANYACNVIVSDDGLQHYALQRDIEIAVMDTRRGIGNGWRLPAGPLRESIERLQTVDFVVYNQADQANNDKIFAPATHHMSLQPIELVNLLNQQQTQPLAAFAERTVHAIAGIGDPQRFFCCTT